MTERLGFGDELGPVKVVHVQEQGLGLEAVLVVDNVARGPSIGGLRMAPDVSTDECIRLARAMTMKNAAQHAFDANHFGPSMTQTSASVSKHS